MRGNLPAPIASLYADLRDRRLLPLVALLVVALVAVPILLGGSEVEDPAPGADLGAPAALSAPEAQPVLVAQAPEIRKYRERLKRFTKKNPFRQQLTGMPGGDDVPDESAPASDPGDGGAAPPPSDPPPSDPLPAPGGSGASDASGSSDEQPEPEVISKDKIMLFWHEIDVKVGPPGESRKRKGIKPGQLLPSKKIPAALFLEASSSSKEASFYVSRDVVGTHGKGECAPDADNCEYLLLKEGQEQRFRWGPSNRIYRLKLAKVHLRSKVVDIDKIEKEELAAIVEGRNRFGSVIDALRR